MRRRAIGAQMIILALVLLKSGGRGNGGGLGAGGLALLCGVVGWIRLNVLRKLTVK